VRAPTADAISPSRSDPIRRPAVAGSLAPNAEAVTRAVATAAALRRAMGAPDKWLLPLVSVSFVSLFLFLSALSGFSASSSLFSRLPPPSYVRRGAAAPPSFAYLLAGGKGDGRKLLRLLLAVYHPRNQYLLHLSADAPQSELAELAAAVARTAPAVRAFGNVDVVGRPTAGTPMGSSGLAATLRAAAALLRLDSEWDWFVTLSAADYPLLTQDGKILLARFYFCY
jgi:hypothetical protein